MLPKKFRSIVAASEGVSIIVVIIAGSHCIVNVATAFFNRAKEVDKGVVSSLSA